MGYNPRQLKRFINNLNLRHGLMRQSGLTIAFDAVLHWGIIEHAFAQAAEDFKDHPATFFTFKGHLEALAGQLGHPRIWEADEALLKELKVGQSLHPYIRNESLVKIVQSLVIEKETYLQLLTFSTSVEPDEAMEVAGQESPGKPPDKELRAGLGEMVTIAAGPFLYGEDKKTETIDTDYKMDIYPVTNRQFAAFIKDKGYEKDEFWSPKGIKWRTENKISRPAYWEEDPWNQPEHPVVGVSHYEAEAFAQWSGKTLPAEAQWERAARGTEGRLYPWGDKFDKEKCNTKESGIGKTTRVTRYPNGISPDGCYDMAGNVWEWTASKDEDGIQVLRGGSWFDGRDVARCANRLRSHPDVRNSGIGFRCVRTK